MSMRQAVTALVTAAAAAVGIYHSSKLIAYVQYSGENNKILFCRFECVCVCVCLCTSEAIS